MFIVRIYNTRNIRQPHVGYVSATDKDFNRFPVEGKPNKVRIHPNEHLYAAVQKQLGRPWSHDFGYQILSVKEMDILISSYDRKSTFYSTQANRLKTLKDRL